MITKDDYGQFTWFLDSFWPNKTVERSSGLGGTGVGNTHVSPSPTVAGRQQTKLSVEPVVHIVHPKISD
jgi:hypothetical protein